MSGYDENERSSVKEIDVTRRQNHRTGEQIDDAEAWLRANDPAYAESKRGWIARKTDALARSRKVHDSLADLQPTGAGSYRSKTNMDPDTPFGLQPVSRTERDGVSDAESGDGELVDSLHFGDMIEDAERFEDAAEDAEADDDDVLELGVQTEALEEGGDSYPGDKLPARSRKHWRDEARRLYAAGWAKRKIARALKVDEKSIRNVLSGK